MVERGVLPLALVLSAASEHDSRMLEEAHDAVLPIGWRGSPRRRPKKLHADRDYDYVRCRVGLRRRGIQARLARGGQESSERLGRHRLVVERTLALA